MKKNKKLIGVTLALILLIQFSYFPKARTEEPASFYEKNSGGLILFWLADKKEVEKVEEYRHFLALLEKFSSLHLNFSFSPSVLREWITTAPDLVAKLKKLQQRKQISIVFPPWYESILPLISDYNPAVNFTYPADIREQIARSWELYQQIFNSLPQGIVPPGGAISSPTIDLLSEFDIRWVVTAPLVSGTPNKEKIKYLPLSYYLTGQGKEVYLFSRENEISEYWNFPSGGISAKERVKLWITQIAQKNYPLLVVTIEGGNFFSSDDRSWNKEILEQFFTQIMQTRLLTFTAEEYILKNPAKAKIEQISPLTWMKDGFSAWVGGPKQNAAWNLLLQARETVEKYKNSGQAEIKILDPVFEEIYTCEAGENFLYFGEYLKKEDSEKVELIFRLRLINIYRLLGHPIPQELFSPLTSFSFLGSLLAEEEETKIEINENEKIFSLFDRKGDSLDENIDLEKFSAQEVFTDLGEEEIVFSFTSAVKEKVKPTVISVESAVPYNVEPSTPIEEVMPKFFIDLYIDLNNRVGAGSSPLLPLRKSCTLPENAWEYCLSIEVSSPEVKEARFYRAKENNLVEEIARFPLVEESSPTWKKFSVPIPKKILSGSPFNWSYLVAIFKQENNSQMQIVDLLVPPGKRQEQILETGQLPAIKIK